MSNQTNNSYYWIIGIIFALLVVFLTGVLVDNHMYQAATEIVSDEKERELTDSDGPQTWVDIESAIGREIYPSLFIYGPSSDEEPIGKLYFKDGKWEFEGEMAESARLFFENFLRPIVDSYIEKTLESQRFELIKMYVLLR